MVLLQLFVDRTDRTVEELRAAPPGTRLAGLPVPRPDRLVGDGPATAIAVRCLLPNCFPMRCAVAVSVG